MRWSLVSGIVAASALAISVMHLGLRLVHDAHDATVFSGQTTRTQPHTISGTRVPARRPKSHLNGPAGNTILERLTAIENRFLGIEVPVSDSALRAEIRALQSRLVNVEQRLRNKVDADASDEIVETSDDLVLTIERESESLADVFQSLDQQFHSEPIESDWAAEASDRIQQFLENGYDGDTETFIYECRSSHCRIESEVRDYESMQLFTMALTTHLGSILPGARYQHFERDDGTIVVQALMNRD
ncbi:MAG: hypothetical protein AAF493_02285 [Pseudomonadota bacterium]